MSLNDPSRFQLFIHDLFFHSLLRPWYRRYAESFDLRGDEKALDFGSGSGALSKFMARRLLEGGGLVTCLDTSEAWIERARKRLRRFPNVEFIHGDITQLDIEEDSFDVAAIHFVLHDIESEARRSTLDCISRVLRDDGRLFIREPTKGEHGMPPEEIRWLMNSVGLEEIKFDESKPLLMRPYYSGVFRKIPRQTAS